MWLSFPSWNNNLMGYMQLLHMYLILNKAPVTSLHTKLKTQSDYYSIMENCAASDSESQVFLHISTSGGCVRETLTAAIGPGPRVGKRSAG